MRCPLYSDFLQRAASDVDAEGFFWDLLEPYLGQQAGIVLGLRLLGAAHRLVLEDGAPALARFYPSAGGRAVAGEAAWEAFRSALETHRDRVVGYLEGTVQTNEVSRCCGFLGAFLEVARRTSLPLHMLEIGSSTGLNLRWDQYLYEQGAHRWGNPAASVRFKDFFVDDAPSLATPVTVSGRRGCDPNPLDPNNPEHQVRLLSYVWTEAPERLDRMRAAFRAARDVPVEVDKASGDAWIEQQLAQSRPGVATVVFHSVVMQYMEAAARECFAAHMLAAGERATKNSPLAWVRFEPQDVVTGLSVMDVTLVSWPGGTEERLAFVNPHQPMVRWVGPI